MITLGVALDTSPPDSELLRGEMGDQENAERAEIVTLSPGQGRRRPGRALSTSAQPSQKHDNSNISSRSLMSNKMS